MIAADTPSRTTHMTISDASEISGKGVTTIRRWLASGEIRNVKDGNGWVWIERQSLAGFLSMKNGGRAGASVSDSADALIKKKGSYKEKIATASVAAMEKIQSENIALKDLVAKAFAEKQALEVENQILRQRVMYLSSTETHAAKKAPDELIDAAQKLAGVIRSRLPFAKRR